jgi:hypothetical protein
MAIEFNAPSQVRPYATLSAFPTTGAVKTIYVALDTKLIYVYDSGSYTEIGDSISAEWGHINGDITSQVDLQTALNAKFDNPTGNSTQYLDGAGTPTTFPAFASADKMVTVGRNSTGSTLYKGTIVYISGSTGNRPNFVKAQANSEMTSAGTFGVIEADIANNADGNCVTIGTIDNLDTRSSAPHPFTSDTLADGDTIYLSPTTAGYITNVKPYAPSHLVYVGKVVRTSPTNGTIVYRIQNGYELDELHDVAAQTPSNNDALAFETSTQLWKPKSITTLLGFTPVPTTRTLTINGTTQDLSADRTFTISTGITIGTTAITSGTVGRVLFEGTGNVVSESANLTFDSATTKLQLGILTPTGTTTPAVLSLGATYSTNAVGSSSNIKLKIYDDNTSTGIYGIGLTSNLLEIHSANTTGIFSGSGATRTQVFSVNTSNSLFGSTTLTATTTPFIVALGGTYGSNTAGSVANLKFKILGSNASSAVSDYGFGVSSGLFEFSASDAFGFFTGNSLTRTERMRIFASGNVGINTTTDAGYKLDVNGTARVQGNLTVLDNNQLGWGNGNYLIANNATPKIDCYVQSSLILTLGNTLFTINVASRTRDLTPSWDNSFDFGGQFGRYRHGWLSGQLKVGDATAVNASAKVQIDSTTQGVLFPRMTTTQKNAIASPSAGLMVYDTTLNLMALYNGTTWTTL